ncbi:histidine kinase [Flavobacteriaceae bacterium R38]|nr:histidine kinase [Flavobacteriaceae bacterium R38]
MEDLKEQHRYQRAKDKVIEIKKFYNDLISFIVVVTFLAILNYWINEWRYAWFLWVVLGWGIGLIFHAIKTFDWNPLFNKDWEERKIKELMKDDKNTRKWE